MKLKDHTQAWALLQRSDVPAVEAASRPRMWTRVRRWIVARIARWADQTLREENRALLVRAQDAEQQLVSSQVYARSCRTQLARAQEALDASRARLVELEYALHLAKRQSDDLAQTLVWAPRRGRSVG